MKRRDFIKYTVGGMTALWAGSKLPPWARNQAQAAPVLQTLNFNITDALKDMATNQDPLLNPKANLAQVYFWIYKEATLPAESPGPIIFAQEGGVINLNVTNSLSQDHAFSIPAIGFSTGIIPPGVTVNTVINLGVLGAKAGTYLYYDDLNAPVNRVMGLHGAFIIMPDPATSNTPYSAADNTANIRMQALFNDFGAAAWWPGLAWNGGAANPDREGIPVPDTPPFRQHIWLLHQASPLLFQEVGSLPGPDIFDSALFLDRFLNDPLVPTQPNKPPLENHTPQYFTISGQSGHFSHNSAFVCPNHRVGEPCIIRVLNAGLWTHSMHIHANHVYVLAVDNVFNQFPELNPGVVSGILDNNIWVDTYTARPLSTYDWAVPYMKPPDVPNTTGNARADLHAPLPVNPAPVKSFGVVVKPDGTLKAGNTPPGVTTWPPIQELNMAIPKVGTKAGKIPIHVPLSPLCFPMHDHSEPSQSSQGGNYNTGLIAGINFTGDRNLGPANPLFNFPNVPVTYLDPTFGAAYNEASVSGTDPDVSPQPPAGPVPPFEEAM